jgi:hypothetical protein
MPEDVTSAAPLKIFINYRRSDTRGDARALFDRLAAQFGGDNVFYDQVTIAAGTRWRDEIRAHESAATAFLALIGPTWVEALAERGVASDDHVRAEIDDALRRGTETVIPVLVGDAAMPTEKQVPPSLRPLLKRQRVALHEDSWDADVAALIEILAQIPAREERVAVQTSPQALPPTPASVIAPRPDITHYDELTRLIVDDGSVVPFLGPGASSSDRDDRWDDVESGQLPDAEELAAYVARKLGLPSVPTDLAHAAQYMAVDKGTGDLYKLLRRTLDQSCPPSSAEMFLARLPATLRRLSQEGRYQLVLTTHYDDALERAFEDADEPYDLAVYMASGADKGRFVHVPFDAEPKVVSVANRYSAFPIDRFGELERTVIVKVHGAVDGARGPYRWRDNYVITEDHFIDYLSQSSVESVVPQQILAKLVDSHFLFLGYTMRDWNLRVFLQRVLGELMPNTSWAIQRRPDRLDSRYWRRMRVDLFEVPLAEYVAELETHLTAAA